MISRLVLDAFGRLAGSSAVMDIAMEVRENFQAAEQAAEQKGQTEAGVDALPSAEQVDSFWDALADADVSIREMRDSASGDEEEALRGVIEDVLESIARGVTDAGSEMTRLVNHCRMLLRKKVVGEDRDTKSRGFTGSLRGFAGRAEGKALGDDMAVFVREAFSGEFPRLVDKYLNSNPYGDRSTRESLLVQQTGSGAAARRQAEGQVFAMLYKLVAGRVESMRAGTYEPKFEDPAVEDFRSFSSVVASVLRSIQHNKVDDQFVQPKTGLETPRAKWKMYVEPLRGTEMYGIRPDLGAILDWINANFHRVDLGSQTSVTVELPGGGSVTAPSFKRKLTMTDLMRWSKAPQGVSSLDAPISAEGDGGTVGESVGKRDEDFEDSEEYKTQYLSDPVNNARIRQKLEAAIHQAAMTASVDSSNLRPVYKMVLLIKLGFASKPETRQNFEKAWREGGSTIVGEGGSVLVQDLNVSHIPFRTELIDTDLWRKLGRPKRKGWQEDEDQRPHRRYRFPWTQTVLVRRDTGEPLKDIRELHKNSDPKLWKIVEVKHTTDEEPKSEHFLNWVPYTAEDRDFDISRTLDAYDGDDWFRMSLQPEAQKALKDSLSKGDPLKEFKPENIFQSYAKNVDVPMWRALGQVRSSVQRHSNSLYPVLSGPAHDMKSVMKELGTVLAGDPDASWVFTYIAQKRLGKVSSRGGRSQAVGVVDMESLVRSIVSDLLVTRAL